MVWIRNVKSTGQIGSEMNLQFLTCPACTNNAWHFSHMDFLQGYILFSCAITYGHKEKDRENKVLLSCRETAQNLSHPIRENKPVFR